jgi:uncharacterized protein (DUF433 family)
MKITAADFDRITIDPEQMGGQPCIRGMRITVKRVLEALTVYPVWEELIAVYPELEKEDIRQALAFAAENVDDSIIVREIAA